MSRRLIDRMRQTWRRLRSLRGRDSLDDRLDEEIRFHLDQQTRKHVRGGMDPDEARRQALIGFGGVSLATEGARDELRPAALEDWARDVRHGARALRRAPAFTAIAVLTLGLGIGAATAVFSVVNGVLIKPLPYPDADALVGLWHAAPGANLAADVPMATTQFFTYRDENRVFEAIGLWGAGVARVTDGIEPEEVPGIFVTEGTLQTLGVRPALGRWFSRDDDAPGSLETVILTHGYWQRRFGGDPSAIGRTVSIDARPRQVIGVMPRGFRFLDRDADVILPYQFDRAGLFLRKPAYQGLARLAPGVTLARANADAARMVPIWLKSWSAPPGIDPAIFHRARFTPTLHPLHHDIVGDVGKVLWVLMATVAIVLIIACANVASLVLVRAEGRQQELSVRAALGASRGRIARALLIESVVLGCLGGALGLALAFAGVRMLVAAGPANLPRLHDVALDPIVLAFALGASLLSGLGFGLIPVVRHVFGPLAAHDLRGRGRTSSQGRERKLARSALVVVQVALALVLLVASGLMVRTFQALRSVQPGFTQPDQVQLVRLTVTPAQASDPARVLRVQREIRDRIAAIPGVTAAAFTSAAPLEPDSLDNLLFVEGQVYAEGQIPPDRRFKFVSPGFFRTAGIPLVAGHDLTWSDLDGRRPVALVSENFAREIWREPAAALGRRIRANAADPWREIVGVVGDVHDDGVHRSAPATVYWPVLMDRFWKFETLVQRSVTFAIRGERTGREGFVDEIRAAIREVSPGLPLAQVRTLGELYDRSLQQTSFTLVILSIAGLAAALLGLVGIYGVVSYGAARRAREIGIRVALGAERSALRRLFVRDGLILAGLGVAAGVAAALPLTGLMRSLLFGIDPLDPATFIVVCVLLVVAAALASYVPARRATNVNPVEALRAE